MAEFMRNSDAFAWAMEHDAGLRSTVVSVVVLDRSPDVDVVRDRLRRIARTVPAFRQRIVETAPPAPPRWEYDPDFDLDYHLRHVSAPVPGTLDTVLEMARRAEMAEFDRARPLWEATVVDGLAGGGAALVLKIHHSLTDGLGGVRLSMLLFDLTETPRDLGDLPPVPTPDQQVPLDGIVESVRYDAGVATRFALGAARSAPRLALSAVRRPRRTARAVLGTAASVYRTVRPINATGSPIMRERRLVRRLGVHEVPLQPMLDAAHACGGTLNDAFLAGVTGGLRRYHSHHGVVVGDLHVTMPVSIRTDSDPAGGNRITLMRFDLPVGTVDPGERVRAVHRVAGAVRDERSLPYTQLIAGALNLLPRWYVASILRHVDFLASDVPGLPVPVFLGGARVTAQYPFGPTIGAGVNVTLMTYVDTCALGINVDTGAIPDFEVFHACLVAGFDEVLALAGEPVAAAPRPPERAVYAPGSRG